MRFASLLLVGGLTACSGGDGGHYNYVPLGGSGTYAIRTVPIDTGATLAPQDGPGQGLGVFVEYATGGAWHVFTVCDSNLSSLACQWDIVASVAKGKLETISADIDRSDQVMRVSDAAVRLLVTTSTETDSVRLASDPGENLQLDVTLDGNSDPNYALGLVFWVTGGAVDTSGAPSNPVVFSPTEP